MGDGWSTAGFESSQMRLGTVKPVSGQLHVESWSLRTWMVLGQVSVMRKVEWEVQGRALSPVRKLQGQSYVPFVGCSGLVGVLSESKN